MAASTPRKRAAARPRIVPDTPAGVALNLDTYEREGGEVAPYVVVLQGKLLTFTDPQEVPWQQLVELDDPEEFARLCLSEEDAKFFLETPLKAYKMRALLDGFRTHYGLNRNPGEAGA